LETADRMVAIGISNSAPGSAMRPLSWACWYSEPEKPIAIPDSEMTWLRAGLADNGCWYPPEYDELHAEKARKDKRVWTKWFDGLAAVRAGVAA
jgi:hypothetical protein